MGKGIYSLVLILESQQHIGIGKLGRYFFKKGYYVYSGSAMGGFGRIKYHLKENKKKRWHIDYLSEKAKIVKIIRLETKINYEHYISKNLSYEKGAEIPVFKFGSSDCKKGCEAHLLYFKNMPKIEDIYKKLDLNFDIFREGDFKNI